MFLLLLWSTMWIFPFLYFGTIFSATFTSMFSAQFQSCKNFGWEPKSFAFGNFWGCNTGRHSSDFGLFSPLFMAFTNYFNDFSLKIHSFLYNFRFFKLFGLFWSFSQKLEHFLVFHSWMYYAQHTHEPPYAILLYISCILNIDLMIRQRH